MGVTSSSLRVAVIGAGPAGLSAAYVLAKAGVSVTVFESDPHYVGGISKTVSYKGYLCDIGGHRFFSKSEEIENLWTEILEDDLITRRRFSRIYYRGNFFSYPLKPLEALVRLGPFEAFRCALSYARARLFPIVHPANLEEWVSNQFGYRLYSIFFKTYTEKVWGMPCTNISADWAAQRIKGLSLWAAVFNALIPQPKNREDIIKTQIDTFRYPRKGPGQMWERCVDKIRSFGGRIEMGAAVTACRLSPSGTWEVRAQTGTGEIVTEVDHVISTAPLASLATLLTPPLNEAGRSAADSLRYRDFLVVGLIVKRRTDLDDQWIYIHDPSVHVGRIQNFRAWSPEMVPDADHSFLGLEYFCFENDEMWSKPDADLIRLATGELDKIGLWKKEDVLDGVVIRQKKAYPVYDETYKSRVAAVREELDARYPGFWTVGRNGMHKYNNQDHSMMTALVAARNILGGPRQDPWRVNIDAAYLEEKESPSGASGERQVPHRI